SALRAGNAWTNGRYSTQGRKEAAGAADCIVAKVKYLCNLKGGRAASGACFTVAEVRSNAGSSRWKLIPLSGSLSHCVDCDFGEKPDQTRGRSGRIPKIVF